MQDFITTGTILSRVQYFYHSSLIRLSGKIAFDYVERLILSCGIVITEPSNTKVAFSLTRQNK